MRALWLFRGPGYEASDQVGMSHACGECRGGAMNERSTSLLGVIELLINADSAGRAALLGDLELI
jgi:hypothetical protein